MPKPTAHPEPAEALLPVLIELFRDRGVDRMAIEVIVAALAELGRPITATKLTRTLKPLGAAPRQFRLSGRRVWGYLAADLAEAQGAGPAAEGCDVALPSTTWAEFRFGQRFQRPSSANRTRLSL